MITGWISHAGPTTAGFGRVCSGFPAEEVDNTFLRLEAGGSVLRGQFTDSDSGETEWCDRRLLARIHRLTLGELRKQIAAGIRRRNSCAGFCAGSTLAPGTQLVGERGMLEVLRQLQGFEAPANSWERQILSERVVGYTPEILDHLCLTGAVGWGRLSPHPATLEAWSPRGRRVMPTSVAPIAFFVREDADWMMPRREPGAACRRKA